MFFLVFSVDSISAERLVLVEMTAWISFWLGVEMTAYGIKATKKLYHSTVSH